MKLRNLHITSLAQPAAAALDDAATRAEWSLLSPLLQSGHAMVRVAALAGHPVGQAMVLLRPSAEWQRLWQKTAVIPPAQVDMLATWLLQQDSALLSDMYVAPGYRRLGIGQALLDDAMACSHAAGRRQLALQVAADNPAAQRLYMRCGFVRIDNPIADGLWFYRRELSA